MKLFVKVILFCLPLFFVFLIFSFLTDNSETFVIEENGIVFLGSSRVRRGIDPELLNSDSLQSNVYNLGLSGATFLHNITLAEYLIRHYGPGKILIELSPIIATAHPDLVAMQIVNTPLVLRCLSYKNALQFLENYAFQRVTLKDELRDVLHAGRNGVGKYGHICSNENNYRYTDSFLTIEDLQYGSSVDVTEYLNLINDLNAVAEQYGTEIRYFLPFTFNRKMEKQIVAAVFRSVSSSQRVNYAATDLQRVCRAEYLFDRNHFNQKGAEQMTAVFRPYVHN